MKIDKSYDFIQLKTNRINLVMTFVMILIGLNYLYLTTVKHAFYRDLATKQHQSIISVVPERGYIFDRHDKPIAFSQNSYSAFITSKNIKNKQQLNEFLNKFYPKSVEQLQKNPKKHFMYIKRHLTDAELHKIKNQRIEDLHLLEEPKRFYPYKSLTPIIGLTDVDNLGLTGLEYFYNQELIGDHKNYILEKDGHTNSFFKKELNNDAKLPEQLKLTIDANIQELVFAELKDKIEEWQAKEGAVVIMDPDNGEIICMSSFPAHDPNTEGNIDLEGTKNRCLTQPYEPGSVIKTFLALAALAENLVDVDEIIDCENKETTTLNGMVINTPHADGKITFSQVIQNSNNIGVAKVALRIGEKLYDYYKKLGFGQLCTKERLGEEMSLLYHPKKWSKRSLISLSYGYEMTANLVQLVRAYSTIVNGGYLVTPHIFANNNFIKPQKPLFSQSTLDTVNDILLKTVNEGTAKRARIKGYTIKAKTGSAYCAKNGGYDHEKSIYTCIAIVEKNGYKRVIGAFIKEPVSRKKIYASSVVVPMIEKIIERVLISDKQIN
jgi:cell division protein FtsI/penicillin-binding protein 2